MGKHEAPEGAAVELTDDQLLWAARRGQLSGDMLLDQGVPGLLPGGPDDVINAAASFYLGSIAASLQVIARRLEVAE